MFVTNSETAGPIFIKFFGYIRYAREHVTDVSYFSYSKVRDEMN